MRRIPSILGGLLCSTNGGTSVAGPDSLEFLDCLGYGFALGPVGAHPFLHGLLIEPAAFQVGSRYAAAFGGFIGLAASIVTGRQDPMCRILDELTNDPPEVALGKAS